MKKNAFVLFFLLFIFICNEAYSHYPNQSYIFLRIYEDTGIEGRYEINTREINKVFGLNLSDNATKVDLMPHIEKLKEYILANSNFKSEVGNLKVVFGDFDVFSISQGSMVQFSFDLEDNNLVPEELTIKYGAIFKADPTHKGFLIIEYNWLAGVINQETNIIDDFSTQKTIVTIRPNEKLSIWRGAVAMIKQGIWHIWIGLDHILFLVALILPSVVVRIRQENKNGTTQIKQKIFGWVPVQKFKPAFLYIVKIVTFFTIAHTITLSLAALNIIVLPSNIVETIIAFSIGLAALHNIIPIFKGKDWAIAFIFGLFHGFGFASVLGDLGFRGENLTVSLLGFNVGVEIGQMLIIAGIFPILFFIRKSRRYQKFIVIASILLIILSIDWVLLRGFNIDTGLDYFIRSIRFNIARWLNLR